MKVSPPTASSLLESYYKANMLAKEHYKNYLLFYANKDSRDFIDLSRIYWRTRLNDLAAYMEKMLAMPTIVLFGSLAKGEAKSDSDVDLAVFAPEKELKMSDFEARIGRKIQIFWFKSAKDIKSRELANNIVNGCVLKGRIVI